MHRPLTTAAAVLLLSFATSTGQVRPVQPPSSELTARPAPKDVLKALALRAATVQDLSLPRNARRPFQVRVVLGGRVRTLDLHTHSLLAPGFRLLVDDGTGARAIPNPPENTYQGRVLGVGGSVVAASLWNRQLQAHITLGDKTWVIQPMTDAVQTAPRATHVVYEFRDAILPKGFCGVAAVQPLGPRGTGPQSSTLQSCEIALDCDFEYFKLNNSNTTTTRNAATAIMNAVDVIYRRDVEICYTITTILIRTSKVYTSGPNLGCGTSGLLQEMQKRWNANHTGIKRDVAHMFTGSGQFIGTIGCASVAVICSQTNGYGVSRTKGSLAANTGLVAHELGHNWSATHCSGSTCFIMCASNQGCGKGLRFGPQAKSQIIAHRNSRRCLGVCGGCRNEADYTFFGSGCAGSGRGSGPGCVTKNFNNTSQQSSFGKLDIAILANTGAAGRQIVGLDLFTDAATAFTLPVWLYDRAAGGGPGKILGTSSMRVGTATAVYSAAFKPPVVLPPKTDFFIAFASPQSPFFSAPLATTGSDETWYFRQRTTWVKNSRLDKWSYRLNCIGTGATPLLSASGTPQLGKGYKVLVSSARPSSVAVLFHAATSATIDLKGAGAPGCFAYIGLGTIFLIEGTATDAAGNASFPEFIPNVTAFCGIKWAQQVLINDPPTNALQWVTTRRGEPLVGN